MDIFNTLINISKILLGISFIVIIFIFLRKYKEYQNYPKNDELIEDNFQENIEVNEDENENQEDLEEELKRLERIQEIKDKLRKNKESLWCFIF